MHKDMRVVRIELPSIDSEEQMEAFTQTMDILQQETYRYAQKIGKELHVSDRVALEIVYLRGRSRWSQELEERIVRAYTEKEVVIVCTSGEEELQLQELGL